MVPGCHLWETGAGCISHPLAKWVSWDERAVRSEHRHQKSLVLGLRSLKQALRGCSGESVYPEGEGFLLTPLPLSVQSMILHMSGRIWREPPMVICHFGEISAKLGVGTLWLAKWGWGTPRESCLLKSLAPILSHICITPRPLTTSPCPGSVLVTIAARTLSPGPRRCRERAACVCSPVKIHHIHMVGWRKPYVFIIKFDRIIYKKHLACSMWSINGTWLFQHIIVLQVICKKWAYVTHLLLEKKKAHKE